MSAGTLADVLLEQLDGRALAQLAERLRPYLDGSHEDGLLRPAEAASRLAFTPRP